jgi:hypothetical protein
MTITIATTFEESWPFLVCATGLLLLTTGTASAKSARCYTSDDGHYNCTFTSTDNKGSFEISAPGKPTFNLYIESKGVASVVGDYGTGRGIPLPGTYVRRTDDPACWSTSETNTTICAW